MRRRGGRGFTIVEIMVVVGIIAVLAMIAIPNALRSRTTANESGAIVNVRSLISALEMYWSVNGAYPADGADAWQVEMYTDANPDFGPLSFANAMSASVSQTVQGYDYTYVGASSGATYGIHAVPETPLITGTRRFRANEGGLIRHCTCPDSSCAMPPDWSAEVVIGKPPTSCRN